MNKEKKVYNIGILIGNAHTSHPKQLIRGICEGAKEHSCNLFFSWALKAVLFHKTYMATEWGMITIISLM